MTESPSLVLPYELPFVQRLARQTAFWMAIVLLALIAIFSLASPDHAFFQLGNFQNMIVDASSLLLLAVGATYILAAGEIDLSVGANVVLSSVLGGKTMVALAGTSEQVAAGEYPHLARAVVAGVAVSLLVGIGFGLVNGLLVTALGISSFIATLATTGIGSGAAFVTSGGVDVPYLPRALQLDFGVRKVFGLVPLPAICVLAITCALWYVMAATRFGQHTVAIGSSRDASVRAGLRVNMHVCRLFVLMGGLAGAASLIDLARFGTTNISGHQTDGLAAIAAAVIGGSSLFGGVASIGGSMIGACIPIVLGTGLVIMAVSGFYQLIAVGLILLVAVYLDTRRNTDRST